jgi:glycogen debranching enzyme
MAGRRVILKEDRSFAVSAPDGSMTATSPDGHGVWLGDTRILAEYRLLINGRQPEAKKVGVEAGWVELELAANGLDVHIERTVTNGMHDRITISNPGPTAAAAEVDLVLGADFAAMLAIRGILPMAPASATVTNKTPQGLVFEAGGGMNGATEVAIRPPGTHHRIHLAAGERATLVVDVLPQPGLQAPDFDKGLAGIQGAYRSWSEECAIFETDNAELNRLLRQSRDDMRMLCDFYPTGVYPTGGLPWFAVPFGRDALFTSMFALPLNPEIARGALRFLAAHQGRRLDSRTEEEPGKILHEVRTGSAVDQGLWPHILYGTVDATPLYLCALAETLDWTNDTDLFDELWPAAEAALEWCERYGDADVDGFIEYSGGIARNQGWKDSNDSLNHVDGHDAPRPAALCEVQGYLYRGLRAMVRKRPELAEKAAKLLRRFNERFWIAREGFVAQALDGSKRKVEAITSNPGHCLWAGIVPPDRARSVAARLVAPDMFSGWGIRTLSTSAITYDPCSYHNGSVWPHDTAICVAGLMRSGLAAEAEMVARAVLEGGMALPDWRLPELWCGNLREPGSIPDSYRASCSPQNWAAASAFLLLTTLLGLEADATRGRLRIAPVETPLWHRLEVSGLHFAGHRIDFVVEGTRVKLGRLPRDVTVETPNS